MKITPELDFSEHNQVKAAPLSPGLREHALARIPQAFVLL